VPRSHVEEQGMQGLSLSAKVAFAFDEQFSLAGSLQGMQRHDDTPSYTEQDGSISADEQHICTSKEL
jgi:hypothetical protein